MYKITNEQALKIATQEIREKDLEITDDLFVNLVDTIFSEKWWFLADGSYVIVNVKEEAVHYEFKNFNNIHLYPLVNPTGVRFYLADNYGNLLENINVTFNGEAVGYNATTKYYELKAQAEDGIIVAQTDKEIAFFETENYFISRGYQKYDDFTDRLERIDEWGLWDRYWWGIKLYQMIRPFNNLYKKIANKAYKGYIITNKPTYQPNDTVRLKAYLTKSNGKPLTRPLYVELKRRYNNSEVLFSTTITPNGKGNYNLTLPLSDTLTLDKRYLITFYKTPQKKQEIRSIQFDYEDYELEKADFSFRVPQKEYNIYEPIYFYAEGKDKRGVTQPDVQISMVILTERIIRLYNDEVIVKDTIWKYEDFLDPRGETRIEFPKEMMPEARLNLEINARLSNSNGVYENFSEKTSIDADSTHLKTSLDNGILKAAYYKYGKMIPKQAILELGDQDDLATEDTIQLPYEGVINPFAEEAWIDTDDEHESIERFGDNYNDYILTIRDKRTKDSSMIYIRNPQQQVYTYRIFRNKKKIAEGTTAQLLLVWRDLDKNKSNYLVEYFTHKERESYFEYLPYPKTLLKVNVKQPQSVQPGETVDIAVKVNTKHGENAEKVNLTALALNTELPNAKPNLVPPDILYKMPKQRKTKAAYDYEKITRFGKTQQGISKKWYDHFGLEKELFYEMRFSEKAIFKKYTPLKDTVHAKKQVEFAVFVFKNHKAIPIYSLYCNHQLVYYYGVKYQPYSFRGKVGKNSIDVRLRDAVYTIRNIELKEGYKLELALDLTQLESGYKGDVTIHKVEQNPYFGADEKRLLRKSILLYRKDRHKKYRVFEQNNQIQILPDHQFNRIVQLGPFIPNYTIDFEAIGAFKRRFLFESGFEYDILKNRERLYQNNDFQFGEKSPLPLTLPLQFPNENQFTKGTVNRLKNLNRHLSLSDKLKKLNKQLKKSKVTHPIYRGKYQYTLGHKLKDTTLVAVLIKAQNGRYRQLKLNGFEQLTGLPSDSITLILYTQHNYFYKKSNIPIQQFQTLYQSFKNQSSENVTFQKDTNQIILNQFLKEYIAYYTLDSIQLDSIRLSEEKAKEMLPKIIWGELPGRVRGTVFDAAGYAVIGVNVFVKGTTISVSTDLDGRYDIAVPEGSHQLVFRYVGYCTEVIDIEGKGRIDITFREGVAMERSVVTGLEASSNQKAFLLNLGNIESALPDKTASVAIQSVTSQINTVEKSLNDFWQTSKSPNLQLRSKFRDYAYWQPDLITDENGEAFFRVTYPDNVTNWRTLVLGMDQKKRFGMTSQNVQSFKPVTAQLELPRFLVEGDKTNLVGKTINYTNDTLAISTHFKVRDAIVQTNTANLTSAIIDKYELTAPNPEDSLKLMYTMQTTQKTIYGDGEQRYIKVFPKGTEETVGHFVVLNSDTTVTLDFEEGKGDVMVYAQKDVLDVLLEDIQYLKNYRYGCNEQTASKLMALLLEKEIKTHLGESFEGEKMIRKMIARLKKHQNFKGTWGWWKDGNADYWITTYVLKVLHKALKAGYDVPSLEQGITHLINELPQMRGQQLVKTLSLFNEMGAKIDYQLYTDTLAHQLYSIHDSLSLLKIQQEQGLEYDLNWLLKLEKTTLSGNYYYGKEGYYWFNNSLEVSLLAYHILRNEPSHRYKVPKIRNYFIEKRDRRYRWYNTFVTAKILTTILPDILKENREGNPTLVIKGEQEQEITTFPYQGKFVNNALLTITKQGGLPVYFTAYQQFFNPIPKPKKDIFNIKTRLIQKGKVTNQLKVAEAAQMEVTLEVKQKADYVMVEVPIPAGCSYGNKNSWSSRTRYEVHREYFRHQTAVFFEQLPVGTYTFRINLAPRFSGTYTLNPAKAEQMYFPVFYGRNYIQKVSVK